MPVYGVFSVYHSVVASHRLPLVFVLKKIIIKAESEIVVVVVKSFMTGNIAHGKIRDFFLKKYIYTCLCITLSLANIVGGGGGGGNCGSLSIVIKLLHYTARFSINVSFVVLLCYDHLLNIPGDDPDNNSNSNNRGCLVCVYVDSRFFFHTYICITQKTVRNQRDIEYKQSDTPVHEMTRFSFVPVTHIYFFEAFIVCFNYCPS